MEENKLDEIVKRCVNIPLLAKGILDYSEGKTIDMGGVGIPYITQLVILDTLQYYLSMEMCYIGCKRRRESLTLRREEECEEMN